MSARIYRFPGAAEPPVMLAEFNDFLTNEHLHFQTITQVGKLLGSNTGFEVDFDMFFMSNPPDLGDVSPIISESKPHTLSILTSENFPNALIQHFELGRSREELLSLAASYVVSYGIVVNLAEQRGSKGIGQVIPRPPSNAVWDRTKSGMDQSGVPSLWHRFSATTALRSHRMRSIVSDRKRQPNHIAALHDPLSTREAKILAWLVG